MGIYDTELGMFNLDVEYSLKCQSVVTSDLYAATQIWELAEGKCNSIDFAEAIDNSDLEAFGFTDDFVIELWGAVTDARAGRRR